MSGNGSYSIEREENKLVFRTSRFSTGTESVLHSGIYNREFASVLASVAVAGLVYALIVPNLGKSPLTYGVFVALGVGGFYLFRRFVFKGRHLEALFDKGKGEAVLSVAGFRKRELDRFPLSSVEAVVLERRKESLDNPDGVAFVEKISLQHGMVIPGFGEEKVTYLLILKLAGGGERVIYTAAEMKDAIDAHDAIKEFVSV